jgi:hypothetical protein
MPIDEIIAPSEFKRRRDGEENEEEEERKMFNYEIYRSWK